jgi:hypothetical protein
VTAGAAASCAAALLLVALPQGVGAGDLGLPAPFEGVDAADVVRVARLDGGGAPSVHLSAVSKAEAEPHLLAVLAAAKGGWQVAELARQEQGLSLVAHAIESGRWDDALELDVAPYRLSKDRRAFGVRYQRMTQGGTSVFLVLYLRNGSGFDRVFEEVVRYVPFDGDEEWIANVQVVPRAEGYNDLRVVAPGKPRDAQLLRWDSAAGRYDYVSEEK